MEPLLLLLGSKIIFDFATNLPKGQNATISGPVQVANLEVVNGTKLVVQESASLTISGGVTVTSGSVDFSSNHNTVEYNGTSNQDIYALSGIGSYHNLTVSNSATTTLPTTLNIKGNLSRSGSGSLNTNSGTVIMNGADQQSISGTDFGFNNLTINNAAGVLLSSNQTVNSAFTFTNGKISTASNALILGESASLSGNGATKYINGNLTWSINAAGSKLFPIGDAVAYSPATINFADVSVSGTLTASSIENDHPSLSSSYFVPSFTLNRYFKFTNSGITFTTADLNLVWEATELDASVTTSRLKVGKYDGSIWDYLSVSSSGSTGITVEDFSSFSDFQVGEVYTIWDGSTSSDWSTAANWSPEEVPGESVSVLIPDVTNDPVITNSVESPAEVRDLVINSGGLLTINPVKALTVHRSLTNNGTSASLLIESDASGTGSLIQPSADVNATVKRHIAAATWDSGIDGWHFLSAPVLNQAIADAFTTSGVNNDYDFYAWNPSSYLWINYKDATAETGFEAFNGSLLFEEGIGYMAAYQQTSTKIFTGGLNNRTLTYTNLSPAGAYQFHLLGNPFSSALEITGDWNLSGITSTVKIWNEAMQSYSDISSGGIIPPTNGFLVEATEAINSLTLPVANKVHNAQNFYKNAAQSALRLTVVDIEKGNAQELQILVHPEATDDFDSRFDSRFIWGYGPGFYAVMNNELLSTAGIAQVDESRVISISFIANGSSLYRVDVSGIETLGVDAWLHDKKTNTYFRLLSDQSTYSFTATAEDSEHRFELVFADINSADDVKISNSSVWYYQSEIYIQSQSEQVKVEVVDMQGRLIESECFYGPGIHTIPFESTSAVYFVKLTEIQDTRIHKIITK
jgi:hypothetical protein